MVWKVIFTMFDGPSGPAPASTTAEGSAAGAGGTWAASAAPGSQGASWAVRELGCR